MKRGSEREGELEELCKDNVLGLRKGCRESEKKGEREKGN